MKKQRWKTIDILKGFAMLMVILHHYNQKFTCNISLFHFFQMGCQIFFVMSGFGVSFSLSKKFDKHFEFSELMPFYQSRYRRIAPSYYFMIVVVFLVNSILLGLKIRPMAFGSNRSLFGIACNVLFIHGLVPSANNNVIPGGWYIGTLMLLYLIAPFLYSFFRKNVRRKKTACLLMIISSIALLYVVKCIIPPQYHGYLVDNNSFGYFSFLTQLPSFALGMLLFFETKENGKINAKASIAAGCVIMACSIALFFHPFFDFSYIIAASAVGFATYFIARGMISAERKKAFSIPFHGLTRFGQKSLYIYLTHAFFTWPFVSGVLEGASRFGYDADNYFVYVLLFPIVALLSYLSAILLEKTVEMIMKNLGKALSRRTRPNQ